MGKQNQPGQWDSNPKLISKNVQKKILKQFLFPNPCRVVNCEEADLELVVASFLAQCHKSFGHKGDREESDVEKWRVPGFRCC